MKKVYIAIGLIILIIVIVVGYLFFPKEIKIFEEYRIHNKEETGGIHWFIISSEESRTLQIEKYNLKIPEVDFNKYYLLWSSGRRIKKITYTIISKYQWRYRVPKGIATFEEKYYPHTEFFYKINKVLLKQDWQRFEELEEDLKKIKKVKISQGNK